MRGRFRSRLLLLLLLLDVHGRSGRARRNFLALQVEWLLAQATLGGILDFGGLCGDFKVFGGTQRCVFELSIRNDKYDTITNSNFNNFCSFLKVLSKCVIIFLNIT